MKNGKLLFLSILLIMTMLLPAAGENASWVDTGLLFRDGFPYLSEDGYLEEGEKEFVFIDPEMGVWRYASQDLRIVITRETTKIEKSKVRYLAAHIFVREGTDPLKMVAHDPAHLTVNQSRYKEEPYLIAQNNGLVFSLNSDYFLYRMTRQERTNKGYSIGIVIRNGQILFDDPAYPTRKTYPPLDMLALYPEGIMRVYQANEITAQQLVDQGATDVLSFGPWLVRDGVVNDGYTSYGTTEQPRVGIGTYGPGHYLAVIAEGRIKESDGLTTKGFSQLFAQLGCPTAFNLDGGWTSAMVFMGQQLNQLDKRGVRNNARPQNEVMGIGYTEQYPEAGK